MVDNYATQEGDVMSEVWNYGDILDAVGKVVPGDRAAFIHGDKVTTWSDFIARSNRIANNLLANGAKTGDKIAFYTRNRPEYPEGMAAGFKGILWVSLGLVVASGLLMKLLDRKWGRAAFNN